MTKGEILGRILETLIPGKIEPTSGEFDSAKVTCVSNGHLIRGIKKYKIKHYANSTWSRYIYLPSTPDVEYFLDLFHDPRWKQYIYSIISLVYKKSEINIISIKVALKMNGYKG